MEDILLSWWSYIFIWAINL